jgi:anaerobic ribonucleoside-triphosphate reductase activating protein
MLRIAGVVKESVVDGPGLRYVIFTQGCPHRCVGCHNQQTHDFFGGYEIFIDELWQSIVASKLIRGITFSGGEPFAQAAGCVEIAKLAKSHGFDVVTYSGYYYDDLLRMAKENMAMDALLRVSDILIDGPFDIKQKDPCLPFRGSKNQNVIYLPGERSSVRKLG